MATPWTRCLLSVLVLTACVATEGRPLPPSRPECHIPCSETDCTVDIICTWDESPDNIFPTNYTLHWNTSSKKEHFRTSGSIPREHAPIHEKLHVWVRASSQDGYADSEPLEFSPEDIKKPPPPKFSSVSHDPLEVEWETVCEKLSFSVGQCKVRHRIGEDQAWREPEDGLYRSYTLVDPIPWTVYEFQVRCSCDETLMSDWSAVSQTRSAELGDPVGEVDVWWDCGLFPTSSDCYLTWKSLPPAQARGVILGYEVRISDDKDTPALINVSATDPSRKFVYDGKKWRSTKPLKNVSSVSVSAYNALGATSPSFLPLSLKGNQQNNPSIYLNMTEDSLTVSWDLNAQLSDDVEEYVVQYKEVEGSGGDGFDWIKVNNSKTAGFTGQFKNCARYQVSLFQRLLSGEVHHLKSVIAFSHEKPPPAVSSFEVSSVGANEVSLVWKPVPLINQCGLILHYQIGTGTEEVHNESASLDPLLIGVPAGIIVMVMVIFVIVVGLSVCQRHGKVSALLPQFFEKVPDPSNSRIFDAMSQQMSEPFIFICIPISGQDPKMSVLEIVERKPQDFQIDGLTGPGVVDGCSQTECPNNERSSEEHDRPGCKDRRAEYSKMIDSDEDCLSSDEEEFTSGYEQHFMPTALEIVGI
ncbi:LOW QUALITY PROTEIN: interleukin 12 receptor, beta 2a, like [Salarias fasciatus]|uniref:LOW QUALITY PROTEIN: interleukin 12 receptor, beta 2a, like n=1 Tax=Salarias fasciatus TaxID=181472 RepID=UPI0011770305|nr:LOW QUALITY PROTEIN: interleukin-6 receptor subunit beta-like [Salarias fasciatus]